MTPKLRLVRARCLAPDARIPRRPLRLPDLTRRHRLRWAIANQYAAIGEAVKRIRALSFLPGAMALEAVRHIERCLEILEDEISEGRCPVPLIFDDDEDEGDEAS